MSDPSLSPEIYRAALPSVRDRPLPDMPGTLYGYVWKVSTRQQVRLCLLSLLVFPLTLAPLELQRRIVDGAIEGGDLQLLLLLGGVYLAAILCLAALKYVRNTYANRVGEGVVRILRKRIADNEAVGAEADHGTRQAILSAEAEKVGGFVAESIALPFLQGGIIVSVAAYMLVVQPLIAAVAIGFLVPSLLVVGLTQPRLNRLSKDKITLVRRLGEQVLGDAGANGGEGAGEERRGTGNDGGASGPARHIQRIYYLRLHFAAVKYAAKAVTNLINHLGPLSVLLLGGWLVIRGEAQVGTIVAFMSGYERMTNPARDLLNFYRRLSLMRVQYRLVRDTAGSAGAGPQQAA